MTQTLYRMHDSVPNGMIVCDVREARKWNDAGWGVFITVNAFYGARRASNLKSIVAWAIDLDTGTKNEMWDRIRSGLVPSLVVETKRGFHVWFRAKDGDPAYWNAIMLDRLVPFYGADKNARDICRVLRAPGYYHMKNPKDPFLVKEVFRHSVSYTQKQIITRYPDRSEPIRQEFIARNASQEGLGGSFWESVWRLDCMDALDKLSGSEHVNHEVFTYRQNANGNLNIYVNGRSTSSFIDKEGRIGSLSDGGPTVYNWLRWYGISGKEAVRVLKSIYPKLGEIEP